MVVSAVGFSPRLSEIPTESPVPKDFSNERLALPQVVVPSWANEKFSLCPNSVRIMQYFTGTQSWPDVLKEGNYGNGPECPGTAKIWTDATYCYRASKDALGFPADALREKSLEVLWSIDRSKKVLELALLTLICQTSPLVQSEESSWHKNGHLNLPVVKALQRITKLLDRQELFTAPWINAHDTAKSKNPLDNRNAGNACDPNRENFDVDCRKEILASTIVGTTPVAWRGRLPVYQDCRIILNRNDVMVRSPWHHLACKGMPGMKHLFREKDGLSYSRAPTVIDDTPVLLPPRSIAIIVGEILPFAPRKGIERATPYS